MSISVAQIKELREKTGCPMMDCKKALVEAEGDVETAVEVLRKKGYETAAKRKDRTTTQGVIAGAVDEAGSRAGMVELLCETDFVARNDDFVALGQALADRLIALDALPSDAAGLLEGPVGAKMQEAQGALKENIHVGRFARIDAGEGERVDVYAHFNGKISATVRMGFSDASMGGKETVQTLLKDLCMQAAFSAPLGISRRDVAADLVEKERALLAELEEVLAKPEKIRPKIIEGKLGKFFKESVLLEQEFVKEKKTAVKKVLEQVGSEAGGKIEIKQIARFEIGSD